MLYEIYVENVGRATETWSKEDAIADFNHYVDYVDKGESVSLFMGEELIAEYCDGKISSYNFVKTDGVYITGFTNGYKREIGIIGYDNHGFCKPKLDDYGYKVVEEIHEEIVEQFPEINNYEWGLVIIPTSYYTIGMVLDSADDIPTELWDNINDYIRDNVRIIDKTEKEEDYE